MGRFVGKALYDRQLIDLPFAHLLLKHLVGDIAHDDNVRTGRALIKESPANSRSSSIGPGFHLNGNNAKRPQSGSSVTSQMRRQSLDLVLGVHGMCQSASMGTGIGLGLGSGQHSIDTSIKTMPVLPSLAAKYSVSSGSSKTQLMSEKGNDLSGLGNDTITEDDLSSFPDDIILNARKFVTKLLLQALIDVKSLDSILYKSLLWMINNDITDVIDETFSVAVPCSDRTGNVIKIVHSIKL